MWLAGARIKTCLVRPAGSPDPFAAGVNRTSRLSARRTGAQFSVSGMLVRIGINRERGEVASIMARNPVQFQKRMSLGGGRVSAPKAAIWDLSAISEEGGQGYRSAYREKR